MDTTYDTINNFCAIVLPPADNIIINDPHRIYLRSANPAQEALSLVNALASDAPKVEAAQLGFGKKSKEIDVLSREAAKQWLDNAFNALKTHLAEVPTTAEQYADDVLYIATTPEFGLNGWQEPGSNEEDDGMRWNARGAFPSSLETYIREEVCKKLQSNPFNCFHILFVFSCFTHSTSTMVPLVEPGTNGPQKIGANNRLSIVYFENHPPAAKSHVHTVTKFAWNDADMANPVLFTPETVWESGTARNDHTQITLPWSDKEGSPVVLGFGTCQDVLHDSHPSDHIVIFCGSGTPLPRRPENEVPPMKHPFLLNDMNSWSVYPSIIKGKLRTDQLYSAGYYQFLAAPPDGIQSIKQRFENTGPSGVSSSGFGRPEMSQYYLYPTPHESDPTSFADAIKNQTRITVSTTAEKMPLFKYTEILPLRQAAEKKKENCIIS
jgi:hypothetical protein